LIRKQIRGKITVEGEAFGDDYISSVAMNRVDIDDPQVSLNALCDGHIINGS
jgi:hypothetical protein